MCSTQGMRRVQLACASRAVCAARGAHLLRGSRTPRASVGSSGRSTSKKFVRREPCCMRRHLREQTLSEVVTRARRGHGGRVRCWSYGRCLAHLFEGGERSVLSNSVSDCRRETHGAPTATAPDPNRISKIATIVDRITTVRTGSARATRLPLTTAPRRRSQDEGHASQDLPRTSLLPRTGE